MEDVASERYLRGMAKGHIESLPSGSYRAIVYAGTDPVTRRPRYLRETCKTETAAVTGDTGDTPGVTELRHPTGDTAMTPNPPGNHQDPPPSAREPDIGPDDAAPTGGGGHDEFHTALGEAWPLSRTQRRRLAPRVTNALTAGWTPTALATHVGANPEGVRSPYVVLASRLADLPEPPTTGPAAKPPWCGQCDKNTRLMEHPTNDIVKRCSRCHPAHQ